MPRHPGPPPRPGVWGGVERVKHVEWDQAAGETLDVLIDLDTGEHRPGAQPGEKVMAIARAVDKA